MLYAAQDINIPWSLPSKSCEMSSLSSLTSPSLGGPKKSPTHIRRSNLPCLASMASTLANKSRIEPMVEPTVKLLDCDQWRFTRLAFLWILLHFGCHNKISQARELKVERWASVCIPHHSQIWCASLGHRYELRYVSLPVKMGFFLIHFRKRLFSKFEETFPFWQLEHLSCSQKMSRYFGHTNKGDTVPRHTSFLHKNVH